MTTSFPPSYLFRFVYESLGNASCLSVLHQTGPQPLDQGFEVKARVLEATHVRVDDLKGGSAAGDSCLASMVRGMAEF